METSPFINNAALLLALSILSTYLRYRWFKEFRVKELVLGGLYGLFTVIAMSMPMTLTPGVFFDGRSIILGLAGLFESPLVLLIAVVIGSAYRIYLGGAGTFTGAGSIVISACVGVLFKQLVVRKKIHLNPWALLIFGFTIHALLLLWFFTFPLDLALKIIRSIAIPYLVVFAITTMLMGLFILSQQQRITAERRLAESEKKYRELVDMMLEGIWMVDKDSITTFVNPAIAAMLGYTPQEMIGQHVHKFIKKSLQEKLEKKFTRRKLGFKDKYDFEYLRKDGSTLMASVATTPVYDEKGEFAGALAAIQDITERKTAEKLLARQAKHLEEMVEERTKDLREAQSQLIKAEKMITLGELAGSVGHELRNPLAVIRNLVYLLKSASTDDTKRREYINLIEQETINASRIITDLLDYSHIQPLKPIPCDAVDIVNEVIERNAPPQNVKVSIEVPRDLPKILVNPQQIGQILANLVANAYEAMPRGGELNISADINDEQVVLAIKDTGKGMSKKELAKIFEPLFTTKPRGIGLGLAISRRLADMNHSEIQVKSQVGEGTIFTINLPTFQER
jgi:PAS domain S-box-containing protein